MDFLMLIVFFSIVWVLKFNSIARKSSKLPPGPYQFPIIGNILHLGPKPHLSITQLSRRYGPVMSLKLGSRTTIVVSSPETAKIVLQKHDLPCSSRTVPTAAEALNHCKSSILWLPVDNQWRKFRKLCKEHTFSVPKLDASQGLRREKLQQLCDYVKQCCETGRAVDIGDAAFTTTMNLISATLFSAELAQFNTDASQEMKDVVGGVMKCLGSPNLADYFPVLKFADPQGIMKEAEIYFGKLLDIFDGIIDDKLKSRGENGIQKNDLLETLLDINQRDESELTRNDIKHLLLDLFAGGTETTSTTVVWAMTELLRHPEKMSAVREEIGDFTRENEEIQDSDIPKLPYLQAAVKETFRLHPAGPFIIPRKAESSIEINGYVIPEKAQILVNAWGMGRDPNIWSNADLFMPERFLEGNDHINYIGKDFELLPFGAGRRICPGLPLGYRMVHLMLAILVGNFEWKLQDGKIDMDDKFALSLQKAMPLMVVPTKYYSYM